MLICENMKSIQKSIKKSRVVDCLRQSSNPIIQEILRRYRHSVERSRYRMSEFVIVSFPKSGRTWLRCMIGSYLLRVYDLHDVEPASIEFMHEHNKMIPRLYLTHDNNQHRRAPDEVFFNYNQYKGKKIILLQRDPRDVIVSLYYHHRYRSKIFHGTLSEFIRKKTGGFETLLRFQSVWEDNLDKLEGYCLIKYEDMRRNPSDSLEKVLLFMGIQNPSRLLIEESVTQSSFESMKKAESSQKFKHHSLAAEKGRGSNAAKVRKGKVGGFIEELNESDLIWVNDLMEKYSLSNNYI